MSTRLQSTLRVADDQLNKGFRVHICPVVFHDMIEKPFLSGVHMRGPDISCCQTVALFRARKIARACCVPATPTSRAVSHSFNQLPCVATTIAYLREG